MLISWQFYFYIFISKIITYYSFTIFLRADYIYFKTLGNCSTESFITSTSVILTNRLFSCFPTGYGIKFFNFILLPTQKHQSLGQDKFCPWLRGKSHARPSQIPFLQGLCVAPSQVFL